MNRKNLLVDMEVNVATSLGRRVVDVTVKNRNGGLRAIESRVGRVSWNAKVEAQIARDRKIAELGYSVSWVFSRSSVTGRSGPTRSVRNLLIAAGIHIVELLQPADEGGYGCRMTCRSSHAAV